MIKAAKFYACVVTLLVVLARLENMSSSQQIFSLGQHFFTFYFVNLHFYLSTSLRTLKAFQCSCFARCSRVSCVRASQRAAILTCGWSHYWTVHLKVNCIVISSESFTYCYFFICASISPAIAKTVIDFGFSRNPSLLPPSVGDANHLFE